MNGGCGGWGGGSESTWSSAVFSLDVGNIATLQFPVNFSSDITVGVVVLVETFRVLSTKLCVEKKRLWTLSS